MLDKTNKLHVMFWDCVIFIVSNAPFINLIYEQRYYINYLTVLSYLIILRLLTVSKYLTVLKCLAVLSYMIIFFHKNW